MLIDFIQSGENRGSFSKYHTIIIVVSLKEGRALRQAEKLCGALDFYVGLYILSHQTSHPVQHIAVFTALAVEAVVKFL